MEKHPKITLARINRTVNELRDLIWAEAEPLKVSIYQCADPIPYGQAVRHKFKPVDLGFQWGPAWSTAWFHIQGEYSKPFAPGSLAALFNTDSEALVWQDGEPAQGLDANRTDFMLTGSEEDVDLFIEAAGNQPFGAGALKGDKCFTLKQAAMARFNSPVWDFYHDLRILLDLAKQLHEDSARRAKLIYALDEAVNLYRGGGETAIPDARKVLVAEYGKPAEPSASSVNAIGHSHIDTAWLWPVRETIRKCTRTFSTVLKYMDRYPEYRYVQSQAQQYAFIKERQPRLYARIKEAVVAGRWEPQGAMWVESDCNLTSGESLVRQILYGTRFFRKEFGVESRILWLPDVFGYSAALPQILNGCRIPYFMTQKISWNQTNKFPHHTFWWEGIDGSRVLCHFLPANTYNGVMTPEEVLRGERNFSDKDRSSTWLHLFGFGDGGGGPTKEMLEACRRMHDTEGIPRVSQGFSGDWFDRMAAEARDLRTWVGELYLELHRGTYTTQAKNKWENRRCEFLLRDAEFLSSMICENAGESYAPDLEHAWKLTLLNQFHDILPGSSIHWVYEDSAKDYAEVHAIGDGVIKASLELFASGAHTAGLKRPFAVWNTLSFPRIGLISLPWKGTQPACAVLPDGRTSRTQLVTDNTERRLLVEVTDVPSMGYAIIDLPPGRRSPKTTEASQDTVVAGARSLENGLVRVELNERGEVISLYDKQAEREIIAEGCAGNVFQRFDDHPNNWDAWDIDPFFDEVRTEISTPAKLQAVEEGPLRGSVRVERELTPKAQCVQFIRLAAGTRRLDFETWIDWHESDTLLKVAFPVAIYSPRATYETQFGHLERPTHRNTSWDAAKFEVAAQKWADLSEGNYGVALLNDGKYGYDIHGNVMRLSLLRSPKVPDAIADMGTHRFTYSLLPHRGDVVNSDVPLAGYELNVPLVPQSLPVQKGARPLSHSFFSADRFNLIIESVKRAEDGRGWIVRMYEAFRRRGIARLTASILFSSACRTDLLERDTEQLPIEDGAVEFTFRPFEIITLRLV